MSSRDQSGEKRQQRFSEKTLKQLEASEKVQNEFKQWVVESKRFSEHEKRAVHVDSKAVFDEYWQNTNDAKTTFERRSDKGCGLWTRRYQSSAAAVQPFMTDFSPIIGIVRDFGAPYGSVALGTISLLFAVAANKNELERTLDSAISAIHDRLPGLTLYQHIYNDNKELDLRLQNEIVTAYQHFINFCIKATRYYTRGGIRRWSRALLPINQFAQEAEEVQNRIVQIRRLCEELLNKNVDTIKQLNFDLVHSNLAEELKAQIRELQESHDRDLLQEVQRRLNLDEYSEEEHRKEWDMHAQIGSRDVNLYPKFLQQMRGPELQSFMASAEPYRRWKEQEQSCLLILAGHNHSGARGNYCWLSPIAAATVENFDLQQKRPFYTYCLLSGRDRLLWDVISVILLQLLRQYKAALRNDTRRHNELLAELGKYHQAGRNTVDKILALEKVAMRVIDFFGESEVIYIVVDRVDRCRDTMGVDHRKKLLKLFVKLVEAARCKLKILTVVDGGSWRVEKYEDELGVGMKERTILHTVEQGTKF